MNTFVKANLLTTLDAEFDETCLAYAKAVYALDNSQNYRELAENAATAAELEETLQKIFQIALQVLEA